MTTYYVDTAVGNDSNAGTSEGAGNAWATIDKAMNTVIAGDKVWVKASGNYNEVATIDTAGSAASPIVFEGYTSTTGDNGKVTIDGQSTRANCILDAVASINYYIFKNFIFTNATGDGVEYGLNADGVEFANCEFTNNGGWGFQGDNNTLFLNCEFSGNSSGAADCDNTAEFVGCIFNGNLPVGSGANYWYCVFYGFSSGNAVSNAKYVVGCTFDHENIAAEIIASPNSLGSVFNNIFYDNSGANDAFGNTNTRTIATFTGYNLFNSIGGNNYRTTNGSELLGYQDVTGAPAFTDEANDDYTLGASSPAIDAGLQPGGIT